ncbi:MAG: restriction endonuclease subunit R [Leptolyngbyaceae cyanobacterium RU_5_1]|nr:restriction endonuclease subunit R [Leptolyngbyaceae cyanobacterium RU_5_1]
MVTLNAEKLSLQDIHRLLRLQKLPTGNYADVLSLEPLTEYEQQELTQIASDFENYLSPGKVSEGLVKVLTVYPLLRLAGFYRYPFELNLEETIARISVVDEDTEITGRFDILAINREAERNGQREAFWVLVIEAKNSSIAVNAALPPLLAYAYEGLDDQNLVWGLVTNGVNYQFVRLQREEPPTYQPLPTLHLFERDRALQLLQALKAICKLQRNGSSDSLKSTICNLKSKI